MMFTLIRNLTLTLRRTGFIALQLDRLITYRSKQIWFIDESPEHTSCRFLVRALAVYDKYEDSIAHLWLESVFII